MSELRGEAYSILDENNVPSERGRGNVLYPAAFGHFQRARQSRHSQTNVRVRGGRRQAGYAGPVRRRARKEVGIRSSAKTQRRRNVAVKGEQKWVCFPFQCESQPSEES